MKQYPIAVWCIMWSLLFTTPGCAEEAEPIAQTPLKTTLALLDENHEVGKPLFVRITITNIGKSLAHYNANQVGINASLIVVGPDGENIPYIDAGYQTSSGRPPSLPQGQSKILVDALDVSYQYLMVKPGTYSIQYRGQRSKIVAIHNKNHVEVFGWPTIVRIPPSNKLLVEVRKGSPMAYDVAAAKLFEIMPENFAFTRQRSEKHPSLNGIHFGPRTKRFVRIKVLLASTKDLPPQKDNKPRPETEVYLGKSPYGHVFLDIPVQLADAMPDAETKICEALEIEKEPE